MLCLDPPEEMTTAENGDLSIASSLSWIRNRSIHSVHQGNGSQTLKTSGFKKHSPKPETKSSAPQTPTIMPHPFIDNSLRQMIHRFVAVCARNRDCLAYEGLYHSLRGRASWLHRVCLYSAYLRVLTHRTQLHLPTKAANRKTLGYTLNFLLQASGVTCERLFWVNLYIDENM